jgi:hypothetical protein
MRIQKSYPTTHKAEAPTEDALAMINRLAVEPVQAEDVFLGKMKLANDQYDRSDERFPKAYLDRFAATLPGKSVMRGHDYRSEPVGRFYDAEVLPDGTGHYLLAKYYLAADGPATKAVKLGISGHVSIGFVPDTRICDLCGKDYDGYMMSGDEEPCNHIKGRMYQSRKSTVTWGGDLSKVEAQEGSLVWLGCQIGAETTKDEEATWGNKAAHFDALAPAASGKGETMDEKELAALQARLKALETENESLKPLAKDGAAYRASLKAEIGRLHTSMEEAGTGATLLKHLDSADAEALDSVRKDADARHAKHFARSASDLDAEDMVKDQTPPKKRSIDEILFGQRGDE